MKRRRVAAMFVALTATILVQGLVATADSRTRKKPLATRVEAAEKVFVGSVVNLKLLAGDWCHADLKVDQAIKGCKVGEIIPVVWRPVIAKYDAAPNQAGLAVLKGAFKERYWLRSDTFEDIKLAKQAQEIMTTLSEAKIDTDYFKGAVLSEKLEKAVIELAQRCGIKQVAKISTHYLRPTAARGITVQGTDQIKGREVSYKTLQVRYKDWWHPGQVPDAGDLKLRDFWAGRPRTRKQTILKVGKIEYRTGNILDLSVEECESILGRLVAGKYTLAAPVKDGTLDQVDWTKPQSFRKRGDAISVSFNHKGEEGGFFELDITPKANELLINQVMQALP